MSVMITVAWRELSGRTAVLEIKLRRIADAAKTEGWSEELAQPNAVAARSGKRDSVIEGPTSWLREANNRLPGSWTSKAKSSSARVAGL